ncbi:universal stress protein [Streptomyces sp. NPDC001617]
MHSKRCRAPSGHRHARAPPTRPGGEEPQVPSRPPQERPVRHPLGAGRPTPRPPGPGHGGSSRPSGEVAMTELAAGHGIVVGVDGSEAPGEALRRTTRQAHAPHTDVVSVHVWEPACPRFAPCGPVTARPPFAERQARGAQLLAPTLRDVFGARSDSLVRAVVTEGPLALGRTPHDQYDRTATGQVARACLRQATVPWSRFPPRGGPRRRSSPPGRPPRPEAEPHNRRQTPWNSATGVRPHADRRASTAKARPKRSRNIEVTSWTFWWDTRPLTARHAASPSGWPPSWARRG